MLAENLFAIRLVVLGLLLFGALLFFFALQRAYYCKKSGRCLHVERSRFRPLEGVMLIFGSAVLLLAVTGIRTIRALMEFENERWSYFTALEGDTRIKEFELAETDEFGMTVLVYPASDMGVRSDVPEEEWLQTQGDVLEIGVEIIRFHKPLEWLGQVPLVRVFSVRGVSSDPQSEVVTKALTEPEHDGRVILDQAYKSSTRRIYLRTDRPLQADDVVVLRINGDGTPELAYHEGEHSSSRKPALAR